MIPNCLNSELLTNWTGCEKCWIQSWWWNGFWNIYLCFLVGKEMEDYVRLGLLKTEASFTVALFLAPKNHAAWYLFPRSEKCLYFQHDRSTQQTMQVNWGTNSKRSSIAIKVYSESRYKFTSWNELIWLTWNNF